MHKSCLILDLAHSLHGQVKRIEITYKSLLWLAGAVVALLLVLAGLSFSYLRMSWKVSQFDRLRADLDHLRVRYVDLQRQANQHKVQMASLEVLASEVSVAYGINQPLGFLDGTPMDSDSMANLHESIEQYNFLQSASFDGIYHHYAFRWQSHNQPSLWPVIGVLRSSFGGRSDPFSGEGAFHTGVDLQVPKGSSVHATADGVVERAGWSGKYGKLVVIDHGNGLKTYYAHLSQYDVVPGQAVRRGEVIALSGATGHATGPHVHYEVRLSGTPVNPYRYLAKGPNPQRRSATHASDLGL
jgi:murein DD-endopeptidase MepM/ murein hydrolase activator NlpD